MPPFNHQAEPFGFTTTNRLNLTKLNCKRAGKYLSIFGLEE